METSSAALLPARIASATRATGHQRSNPMSKKSRHQAAQSVPAASPVVESVVDTPVLPVAEVSAPEVPSAEVPSAETTPVAVDTPTAVDTPYDPYAVSTPTAQPAKKKYPRVGGKCWQVWNFCDQMVEAGTPVNVKLCRDHATAQGWNVSNASQEFYAWRKFTGYGV